MTISEYGRVAYEAYGAFVDWRNYQDLPMPPWKELPTKIQDAWAAAAMTVLNHDLIDAAHETDDEGQLQ